MAAPSQVERLDEVRCDATRQHVATLSHRVRVCRPQAERLLVSGAFAEAANEAAGLLAQQLARDGGGSPGEASQEEEDVRLAFMALGGNADGTGTVSASKMKAVVKVRRPLSPAKAGCRLVGCLSGARGQGRTVVGCNLACAVLTGLPSACLALSLLRCAVLTSSGLCLCGHSQDFGLLVDIDKMLALTAEGTPAETLEYAQFKELLM